MRNFLAWLMVMTASPVALAADLREGVYKLTGTNPGNLEAVYIGTVTIQRTGDDFQLTWAIGPKQTQSGVAYLDHDVLSVSYLDASGQDEGVVSYRVLDGKLEGRSDRCGTETLEFLRAVDSVPANGA
jgi:hypothetical protein